MKHLIKVIYKNKNQDYNEEDFSTWMSTYAYERFGTLKEVQDTAPRTIWMGKAEFNLDSVKIVDKNDKSD